MENKKMPILFNKKEECCGCTACESICTQKAISMKKDEMGFWYPQIDKEKCVKCYLCQKVCPFKNIKKL